MGAGARLSAENGPAPRGSVPSVTTPRTDPPLWHPASGTTVSFDLTVSTGLAASMELYLMRQATGDRLLTWSDSALTTGHVTVPLDGRAQNALWLAEGPYTIEIVVTDTIGNVVRGNAVMTVRY